MTKQATVYWSLWLVAATALVGGRQLVVAAPRQANAPLDERVAAIVKSEMLAKGIPSVSVAVMRDGKMLLERAWGVADIEKNVSASASTTYFIGSNTKQFTAALLLKQVERGRLALTDPIGKHLTGLSPEVGAVTIEQLLNHTSGLQRSVVTPERRFENVTVETLLTMAAGGKLETKPGTTYTYSNAGYAVLGILVEKLYGKKYGAAQGLTSVYKAGPKFELVAQNALSDYCLSSIAVSEGQIFLRTSGHLWVIGNRKK